jgi:hypothetical protein
MSLELCTLKASITSQVVTIAGDRRRVEVGMRFIPSAGETCPHAKPGVSLSKMYVL